MTQVLTAAEVKKHNNKKSVWIVIRNEVYDVTKYLEEHPGGEDPLLDAAGQDATIAFDDIGHSADAKLIMEKYKIGSLVPGESWRVKRSKPRPKSPPPPPPESSSRLKWALLALGSAVIIGFIYKKYIAG